MASDTVAEIPLAGFERLLQQAASAVAARFDGYADADDLYHDAVAYWYGPLQKQLPGYLTDEEPRRIYTAVARRLHRACQRVKAEQSGYQPEDQHQYGRAEVDDLLPFALGLLSLPEMRGEPEERPGGAPPRPVGVFSDMLAGLVDVRTALDGLPGEDRYFLRTAERWGRNWPRLAGLFEATPETLARRHARLVGRMCRLLGREADVGVYETHELP